MLFIFDMGGVVTTSFQMSALYKTLNMTENEFFSVCGEEKNIWNELQTGMLDSASFWAEFNRCAKKQFPRSHAAEHDLFRLYFHPVLNEETVRIIERLKKNHRVVCGTNTIQSHWENHMERGDYRYFHQTYASNKIGERKPDRAFFSLICEAEGCATDETFFCDDLIENVKAAEAEGIHAVQFVSASQLEKEWSRFF